eukprot:scaffold289_cov147-Amphora_coffeaeformis.AAC.6
MHKLFKKPNYGTISHQHASRPSRHISGSCRKPRFLSAGTLQTYTQKIYVALAHKPKSNRAPRKNRTRTNQARPTLLILFCKKCIKLAKGNLVVHSEVAAFSSFG